MTLVEFLLARIAEDEAVAGWRPDVYAIWSGSESEQDLTSVGDIPSGRLLAECEAKRQIIGALDLTPCPCQSADRCVIHDASAGPPSRERYVDRMTEVVLGALASVHADHPDYREEWAQ